MYVYVYIDPSRKRKSAYNVDTEDTKKRTLRSRKKK